MNENVQIHLRMGFVHINSLYFFYFLLLLLYCFFQLLCLLFFFFFFPSSICIYTIFLLNKCVTFFCFIQCPFGKNYFCQLILLFSLFLLLFIGLMTLFGTIHKSHYIISANFYFYLQYFHKNVFNFNKISEFQTDP